MPISGTGILKGKGSPLFLSFGSGGGLFFPFTVKHASGCLGKKLASLFSYHFVISWVSRSCSPFDSGFCWEKAEKEVWRRKGLS